MVQHWELIDEKPREEGYKATIEIKGPGFKTVKPEIGYLKMGGGPYPSTIMVFQMQPFPVNESGEYEIITRLGDESQNRYVFYAGVPRTDDQWAQLR